MEDLYNYLLKTPTINPNVAVSLAIADASDDTADATATASDIKEGKTAYIASGKVTGTLEELDTSDANATPEYLVQGKTAYVNGEKITGTVVNKADGEVLNILQLGSTADDTTQMFTINGTTHVGRAIIADTTPVSMRASYAVLAQQLGITPDKIKAGEVICGVTGTYTGSPAE